MGLAFVGGSDAAAVHVVERRHLAGDEAPQIKGKRARCCGLSAREVFANRTAALYPRNDDHKDITCAPDHALTPPFC
jgi:hypothetical protein